MQDEHLTTGEVVAYLEKSLTAPEQERVEHHLARCVDCRDEVVQVQSIESVSRRPGKGMYLGIGAVVAAAVVALVLVTPFGRQLLLTDIESPTRSSATEGAVAIGAIAPADGDRVTREGLTLLWHSVSAETSYQITLTNPQGDVVWTARTSDTTAAVPATVELIADASYYWYVDALLEDGRPATTGIQRFVVGQ